MKEANDNSVKEEKKVPYENSIYTVEFFDKEDSLWKTVMNENKKYPIFKSRSTVMEIAQKMKKEQKGFLYRVNKFRMRNNGKYKFSHTIKV